ncbi:MAG: PHP domain-containing protein [bacterium]|nr:PHP domain-containing protein [bacterium]MCP5071283.1 PHP domain-containing protein [bacterium]
MILDLHAHSIKSDDGRAKVENYCQWIRRKELPIDGFVLTEHRLFDFDSDYQPLADEFDLCILKGSEVETDYGHVLVFGVSQELMDALDFTSIRLPLARVLEETERHDAIAVPCHPGRTRVGMCAHVEERGIVPGVRIIELYNGGSRGREDAAAHLLAEENGYQGIGGSDAHIVSHIGRCATRFPGPVDGEASLVEALRSLDFEAVTWK